MTADRECAEDRSSQAMAPGGATFNGNQNAAQTSSVDFAGGKAQRDSGWKGCRWPWGALLSPPPTAKGRSWDAPQRETAGQKFWFFCKEREKEKVQGEWMAAGGITTLKKSPPEPRWRGPCRRHTLKAHNSKSEANVIAPQVTPCWLVTDAWTVFTKINSQGASPSCCSPISCQAPKTVLKIIMEGEEGYK